MIARTLVSALALTLCFAAPSLAQISDSDREDEYQAMFQEGLKAITARDLQRSEALFKGCVQLYGDRPTAYYNLACTYSLWDKPDEAVKWLKQAYEHGFRDLAHISRDMDLDKIRRTPAFRAAMGELEQAALKDVPEPLALLPKGDGKVPLLVFVHDDRGNPLADMTVLREIAGDDLGLFVPQAPLALRDGTRAWDGRAEFLVMHELQAYLEANPRVDRSRVYVAGRGISGYRAVGLLAHHTEVFSGVLATGPAMDNELSDLNPSGSRAYLVVSQQDANQVSAGVHARDVFVDAGSSVVLERYAGDDPFADRAVLMRGLAWLQGHDVQLPGEGTERSF